MDQQKYDEIIELMYRNQIMLNRNKGKQEFVKAKIGKNREEIRFPIQHLLYLPLEISNTIIKHINNVERIQLDFKEPELNQIILDYYSRNCYENIFKYKEEEFAYKIQHLA